MVEFYTERTALRDYITWIQSERRRLGEEYWRVIERLKNLDKQMENHTETSSELMNKLIEMNEKQTEVVGKLGELVPSVPANVVAEFWEENISKQTTYSKVSTKQIEKQRDIEDQFSTIKRKRRNNIKELSTDVVAYLKESGAPVQVSKVEKFLVSKGYNIANSASVLSQAMSYDNRIERPLRGFYQYRG